MGPYLYFLIFTFLASFTPRMSIQSACIQQWVNWQILIFSYVNTLNFINRCCGSLFWLLGVPIRSLFHKQLGPYIKAWTPMEVPISFGDSASSAVKHQYLLAMCRWWPHLKDCWLGEVKLPQTLPQGFLLNQVENQFLMFYPGLSNYERDEIKLNSITIFLYGEKLQSNDLNPFCAEKSSLNFVAFFWI